MKTVRNFIMALLVLSSCVMTAWTSINFGSRDSGFVVSAGTLDLTGATLVEGSLRDTGGTLSTSAVAMTCTQVTIEARDGTSIKSMTVDGSVKLTDADVGITLGNSEKVLVQGGSVTPGITATGATTTPSIVEGYGELSGDLTVAGGKQLNLRWSSALNQDIVASGDEAVVKLEQDFTLAAGFSVVATDTSHGVTIDCNGYRLALGGDETTTTSIPNPHTWSNANIWLTGPLSIAANKTVTLSTSGAYINGNGNRFTFNTGSVLANGGQAVTVVDTILSGLTSASIAGTGDWTLVNTTLEDATNSLTINGSITSTTVDVFGGSATFGASTFSLNKNLALAGTWTLGGASLICGNGNVCNLASGTLLLSSGALSLADITLTGVVAASLNADAVQSLYLSNVSWMSAANGGVRINGLPGGETGAALTVADSTTAGNIFATAAVSFAGAIIELLTDVTLATTWSFTDNTIIDGCGHHIDLANGTLSVASGKTLTLRNVVLDNVKTASLADTTTGTVHLSNVTIILGGADVEWGAYNTCLVVDGPLHVVTGTYVLRVPHAGGTSVLNGVTAYYDTLSAADFTNLVGFSGTGRVMFVESPVSGHISVTEGTTYLGRNEYLVSTSNGVAGRTISFNGAVTYDGLGRSLVFPSKSSTVFTVANGAVVKTKNILFDGVRPEHLSISGTLYFGDKTVMQLHQDWALATTFTFGTADNATNEVMTLDLLGHTIDMSNASAAITLQGSTGNVLRICNGRLINLSGTKLAAQAGTKIILENIELELSDNYTYADAALDIEGRSIFSGVPASSYIYTSTADLMIKSGSVLTIADGIVYHHNNEGTTNFVMSDATSRLELIGSTFKRKASPTTDDKLALTLGTLIIDHKSTIDVGSKGIQFGTATADEDGTNDLSIVIRPAATVIVAGSGTLLYDNSN